MEKNAQPYQRRGQKWQVRFLHARIGCIVRDGTHHYAEVARHATDGRHLN